MTSGTRAADERALRRSELNLVQWRRQDLAREGAQNDIEKLESHA